ncbi:uncharacterized protein PODANS_6_540 [Podospora anserina S mat+]|uniref:Podospora anserina S mat+ genomic DNA chromosome 6, supercontig 2 n=1 Tax=Podospora anserina (strain S / ATCC MYA-4624 / DSM 980 / FGSC 10383) TaxID=515849 RepID=B2B3B2_PODAN|nr:uncharacterized protein PODANS_6_540 [Podospora anserina S mat+]CAP71598.1 unnamed protein product [Podospora anserina S mat+]CDP30994.1 Putative protein of unknown function [Podospora anserina S mat+]
MFNHICISTQYHLNPAIKPPPKMNPSGLGSSGKVPQNSHTGAKATGGKVGSVTTGATAGLGEDKPKVFDSEGAIGKQFTEDGVIGSIGQNIGGPLHSEGMIGKQFTDKGAIGGTVQDVLGGTKKRSN